MVGFLHESRMAIDSQLGVESDSCMNPMSDGAEVELHADDSTVPPCTLKDSMDVANVSNSNMHTEKKKKKMTTSYESEPKWVTDSGLVKAIENRTEVTDFKSRSVSEVTEVKLECCMETQEGFISDLEIEVPIDVDVLQEMEMKKCDTEIPDGIICGESCPKLLCKETSNGDTHSEVSNPNPLPKQLTSESTAISNLPASDVIDGPHGACGEITSICSLNSYVDGADECEIDSVSTSDVVLEIPKHIRPTGIRKITFKFNKRKENFDNEQPALKPMVHDDAMENSANGEWSESKEIVPDNYPSSVKELLSTRILEGARVKYIAINGEKQIPGIIKDRGFLCGCSVCNFSEVVTAHEFEIHASAKTRHPNNHIYLENGKPIYSIVQELRMAPLADLEVVIKSAAGSSLNEEYFKLWKSNLEQLNVITNADGLCQRQQFDMHQSTIRVSSSSIFNHHSNHTPSPASLCYPLPPLDQQSHIERKRLIKKPRHYLSGSPWEHKRGAEGGAKKRDNDLHKLLFMPNGLPDGTSVAYYTKGKMILGGYKQKNGIVCSCCNEEISPSKFEAHAGWAAKRQPYRHIYTSTGLTLHDIALMLANGQNLATSGSSSDDMCAICGEGGDLAICNGCPRAFHATCLGSQHVPASEWHCPHCRDKFAPARKTSGDSRPVRFRLKRLIKAPEDVPGGCVVCRVQDFSGVTFDDRTVMICDQCEKEYHVGCLRQCGLCDLKELPEDKWFCRDECHKIFEALQNLANSGPEVIPASVSAPIYKHAAIDSRTESKNETHIQWCVLSGKSRVPEDLLRLSRAVAIFRECFDPIVTPSGRDLIPVMVYGRNVSGQEFSGMYCVVLLVESVVVSAALLRIFGQEIAELPLVATTKENQGKGYFRALFSCIERFLSSLNVKMLVLPAAEAAEAMWTKKLGFRRTSNEQMLKYTRDLQLTVFAGTSLLEKEVEHIADY